MVVQSIMKRKQDCKLIPNYCNSVSSFHIMALKKNLKEVVKISIDS